MQISEESFVIQGSYRNWYHSLSDIEQEGVVNPKPPKDGSCHEECKSKLNEKKRKWFILWAFRQERDYKKLKEATSKGNVLVIGVVTKRSTEEELKSLEKRKKNCRSRHSHAGGLSWRMRL